jgi:hypothetical protein
MNICYYLSLKRNYQRINNNINSIVDNYNEIINKNKNHNFISDLLIEINEYKNKNNKIKNILNDINTYLLNNCDHIYVEDTIDINPEKSQNIVYCKICECTK